MLMDSTTSNWEEEPDGLRNVQLEHSLGDIKQEVMCQELVAKTLPLLLLQGYFLTNELNLVLTNIIATRGTKACAKLNVPQYLRLPEG